MQNKEPNFLTVEEVTRLNAETIQHHGGSFGIRDQVYLESAVLMPQQRMYNQYLHPTIEAMSGAYLFHICQNHPFQDGNKRTALLACETFLRMNGKELSLPQEKRVEMMLQVASGQMKKDELIASLQGKVRDNPILESSPHLSQAKQSEAPNQPDQTHLKERIRDQ